MMTTSGAYSKSEEAMTDSTATVESFHASLSKHGLILKRSKTTTLQVNIGLRCNQKCRHCHHNAGPDRSELMTPETIDHVVAYGERCRFETIDITGGAPELHPDIDNLIERLAPLTGRIMIRSNLTAMDESETDNLTALLKHHHVVIVASLPSLNSGQTDAQRGNGIYHKSISVLQKLNALGYGQENTDLELNLVSNPSGAFIPPPQKQAEKRFREVLGKRLGIRFNNLFNFGNVPLGRFRRWLIHSGNYETYIRKLSANFNPCATEGLMCRSLVSVSWTGYLYDCDFNMAKGLYMGGRKVHISDMPGPPDPGNHIAVSDHCYTCTAGEGFT